MNNLIRKNFTQIPNELINDSTISRDARFLFVYLCSKPDDWIFYTKNVEKALNFSKDTRIKYMKELVEKGWISTQQKKNDKGFFGATEIVLHPYANFSDTEKTSIGKSTTHNNNDLFTNTDFDTKKERRQKSFLPPSLEDVKIFIEENQIKSFTAEQFWFHYDSKNWMVGKNKMKNWKSAAAGWESRSKEESKENQDGRQQQTSNKKEQYTFSADRLFQTESGGH